jgi:L,D-transpeptidase ErfK/SrfK
MRVAGHLHKGVMRRWLIVVSVVFAGVFASPADSPAREPETITGGITTYIVAPDETLTSIAARFGVDPSTIESDNRLAAGQSLEPGDTLLIDNRHIVPATVVAGEIVVNVPQRMLFYRDKEHVFAYPVAVGQPTWQTPRGAFTVIRKDEDPAWHVPASIRAESARKGQELPLVVPPGPRNPLGSFWIGLSLGAIGLHGTPVPTSIYRMATHGCIRLQGDRIEDLYGRVDIGTRGRIVYEPVLLTSRGDDVYLEVHADAYRRATMSALQKAHEVAARLGLTHRIDWTLAAAEIERRAGIARRVSPAQSE